MTSLSTRFLGHPRLTKPIFTGLGSEAECSCAGVSMGASTGMRSFNFSKPQEQPRRRGATERVKNKVKTKTLTIEATEERRGHREDGKRAKGREQARCRRCQ